MTDIFIGKIFYICKITVLLVFTGKIKVYFIRITNSLIIFIKIRRLCIKIEKVLKLALYHKALVRFREHKSLTKLCEMMP